MPWVEPKARLATINAILQNPKADGTKLQQAEEELRQVIHQLTATWYRKVKGVTKSPHTLNCAEVRRMLHQCGAEAGFVNQVTGIFETVDPAHHAAGDYTPNRERIRQFYDRAMHLFRLAEGGPQPEIVDSSPTAPKPQQAIG